MPQNTLTIYICRRCHQVLEMASDASKGIMTFYPTAEEFKDFRRYVAYMESKGAHKAGLAKIVPPKEWKPRHSYDDIDDLVIPAPIQQVVTGVSGLFTQYNIQRRSMTVREFRRVANSNRYCSPHYDNFEELERKYWKNVTFNAPLYGADVNGTLYDPDVREWNICHLDTILDTVERDNGITIEGVNTPYLYFGMWKTTFPWHTEDMDLYSINYLHFGEPKSWYCIPPEHGKRFERLAQGFFPNSAQNCDAFLRHKMTLISPFVLKKYSIPFERITQEAGEFMITFPYSYHAGFNHGFNCAESTNFATERWIEYGKQAVLCSCRRDMVKISMDVFVKKYQPDRYEQWLEGRDLVPIDHSRPTPEAKEFLDESFNDITSSSETSSIKSCGEDGQWKRWAIYCTNESPRENELFLYEDNEHQIDIIEYPIPPPEGDSSDSSCKYLIPETRSLKARLDQIFIWKSVHISTELPLCLIVGRPHCKLILYVIQEEKEEWAKPLTQLWQCLPFSPAAEREYNKRMGQQAPYCSICLLFYTHHQSESNTGSSSVTLVNRPGGQQWSKPLIPEMCFNTQSSKITDSGEGQLSNPNVAEDGTSRLVSCTQCCVRVHTSKPIFSDASIKIDCCLCSLRGGALQRANNDKWVHVLCAITVLEARFVNITERSPVDLSAIPLPRFRLKCVYCRKRIKREVKGCCVQCSHGRCSTAFHPTCAQAAGVLMHPDDWPFIVFITCHRHRAPRSKAAMQELVVGQKVICKYKNGRYYQSELLELTTATFYEVVFDDGSFSDNLFPEDIENRDCVRLGPPAKGDTVQVRWTDGLIYGAKFVASHSIPMYLVEFEDGSQISVKREDIYTLDEDLPKRVKSRMSVASDMRFELFAQNDVKQNTKRQRVINSRYREDYIEPVIYRAIME
uniref:[histone H3]-trimethyl-L-lysine(9) demethylase n=1 Tax=Astatotilapia calliptera TaxID=8154 RepID=A0AAX7T4Y6_ASTCA